MLSRPAPRSCYGAAQYQSCIVTSIKDSSSTRRHTSLGVSTRCSSSSTRWKSRQGNDSFAREARVRGLKSRAAFKLLEVWDNICSRDQCGAATDPVKIDAKYKLFKKGQTVVDLVGLRRVLHSIGINYV